jgi:dsDNA-binding SOS-regulon protein
MASLGDAFSTAVQLFSESNTSMADTLSHLEQSLDQSSSRSDEQLAYYVAQAREIIDHSILSQKQMLEQIQQLGRQENLFVEAAS